MNLTTFTSRLRRQKLHISVAITQLGLPGTSTQLSSASLFCFRRRPSLTFLLPPHVLSLIAFSDGPWNHKGRARVCIVPPTARFSLRSSLDSTMVSKASPLGVFALFTLLSHTVSAAVSHATATEITYSPKTTPVAGIAQLDPFVPLSLHALVHVANLSFSEDELLRNDEILRRTTTDLWGRDNSPRDHLDASLEQRDLALASRLKIQVSETCQDETSNDLIISSVSDSRPILAWVFLLTPLPFLDVFAQLFYYGGVGTTVFLCPNTVINITSPSTWLFQTSITPGLSLTSPLRSVCRRGRTWKSGSEAADVLKRPTAGSLRPTRP